MCTREGNFNEILMPRIAAQNDTIIKERKMNTANRVTSLSILAIVMLWSVTSAHADETVSDKAENLNPQVSTVERASDATAKAAADAAASIAEEAAVDLEVLLTDLTLAVKRAAPTTIAAN